MVTPLRRVHPEGQRHWNGLTPTDAVLPGIPGREPGPLASVEPRRAHRGVRAPDPYRERHDVR